MRDLGAAWIACPAGREEKAVAFDFAAIRQVELESGPSSSCVLDTCPRTKTHTGSFCFKQECVDHCAGRIRDRKHSAVAFGLQTHAPALEPRHSVVWRESVQRSDESAFTPRIPSAERAQIQRGCVRNIAASAARDAHLRQEMRAAFVDGDFIL